MSDLRIGAFSPSSPVFLAPMAGYTDHAFRMCVRRFGGLGLAFTEMLNPRSFFPPKGKKLNHLLMTSPPDVPLSYQIYGHEPEILAEGTRWLQDQGTELIDINMGCPQKKIARRGDGAGLLRDPDLAVAVAKAVVEAASIPVTAKIRTGYFNDDNIAADLSCRLEDVGIAAVTVHARTGTQMFQGFADWNVISEVKNAVKEIPVIGNGDINSVGDAIEIMKRTGCDGVMIARQAIKEPWLMRDITAAMEGRPPPQALTQSDKSQLSREHLREMAAEYGDELGSVLFRRWIPHYAKMLGIGREQKVAMLESRELEFLDDALASFSRD